MHPDSQPIERRPMPSRAELERDYLSPPGRPVILTGAIAHWPALSSWTFASLADRLGDPQVTLFDNLFAPARPVRMTLRIFLRYCEQPALLGSRLEGRGSLYLALQPFMRGSSLLQDFSWPPELSNLYASHGEDLEDWFLRKFGVLLIGPAGTVTPWHEDLFATHAWLAQIQGRKHFVFSPPDAAAPLARPSASATRARTDADDAAADAAAATGVRYEGVVEPGELMLFPCGWRHRVTALSASISLSFNFVNDTNLAAHLFEIFRDLPAWAARLDSPSARQAFAIGWTQKELKLS